MFDVVFAGGLVVDTRTRQSRIADVGVRGGVIAAVSTQPLAGRRVLDVRGKVVCPGFVDAHAHLDGYDYGGQLAALQGITTTIGGNCGLSPLSMGEFFAAQERQGYVLNQLMLVGHSFSMRQAVGLEDPYRRASASQLAQMRAMARAALCEGACGISLGLDYSPGASLAEIDAMAEEAAACGRILAVHTRLFTQNDLYSLYELLAAIKRTGGRLVLSHFVYQYSGFGTMEAALDVVDAARAHGLDVWMDTGMYTDWATYINTATFDERTIKDNALRFGDMVVATGKYTGQRLNRDLYTLLRTKYPDESVICFTGCAQEIYAAMKKPYAMVSTDAGAYAPREGHPQIAGSFPKYFREMVREQGLLTLEQAVYKATLLPCETFGIAERGVLEPGYAADVTVLDPEAVREHAQMPDEGDPDAPPEGIPYVMVNGVLAVDDGLFMDTRSGMALRADGPVR